MFFDCNIRKLTDKKIGAEPVLPLKIFCNRLFARVRYVDLSWSNSGVGFRFLAESWLRLSKSFLSLMLKNSSKQRTNPVYDNSKPGSAPILALYKSEFIRSSRSFAFVSQCKGDTLFFAGDFSDTERFLEQSVISIDSQAVNVWVVFLENEGFFSSIESN